MIGLYLLVMSIAFLANYHTHLRGRVAMGVLTALLALRCIGEYL